MAAHPVRLPVTAILLALLSGTALSLPVLPAAAQQTDPAPGLSGSLVLDPIVVRARDIDGNAADRGTSEYVADAELERARMGDLRDLFAGIASVSVGGAIPLAQKIFVNGVDMLNTAVTVDGVSQNNRIFHHLSANAFDPGLMRFVRVDAGVAAADAGPNALAGAVVMETVDAADILDAGQRFGGNLRLSYDSNGKTFGRSGTLAMQQDGFEVLAYLKSATGDDYKTGAGRTIAGTAADLQAALLKLAFEADSGHRFELSAQRMRDDALRRSRANIDDIFGGRPYTELRRYDTTRTTYALSYENSQAEGLWDPRIVLGFSDVAVKVDQPDFPTVGRSDGSSDSRNGKIENRFHLNDTDTITAGVDFYSRSSHYLDAQPVDLTEKSRNLGIYAQARLEPAERLSVSTGLRFDRQKFTGVDGWRDTVSGFSGNASVAYELLPELSLRAGISSVFGGIALEDNFLFDSFTSYDGLKPARSRNHTIGFDYELGELRLDGEVFVTAVDNARGVLRGEAVNFDFESRGYNLGLGYGWEGGFLRASYAHSKIEVNGARATSYDAVDLGAPLGGVFAIEAQHNPAGSDFTYGGSVQAAQAYDDLPEGAERTIPGYAVLNLFVEYASPTVRGLTIRAAANNILDKDYADRATYGADFNSVAPLKEPGRSLSLVASMRF